VPATYAINHNLPFLLGFISLLIMLGIAINFTYPAAAHKDIKPKNPFLAAKNIVTRQNLTLFIFAGSMAGVMNRGADYRELLYQDLGIAVASFGLLLALGSVVGAVLGWVIHLTDRLKPIIFYFIDLIFISLSLIIVGISTNPIVAVIGFTLFASYARVRIIIVQAKLLSHLEHSYKATLLSALNMFSDLGEIGAVSLLAVFIVSKDYTHGYLLFGISVLTIGLVLWLIMYLASRQRAVEKIVHPGPVAEL